MHVAVDDNHYSYYAYDYSGERRIKLTGDNSVLDVNAEFMSTVSTLENVTLYPSSYMVLTDRGYTKHYYTGMERVAARIGDGGLDVGFPEGGPCSADVPGCDIPRRGDGSHSPGWYQGGSQCRISAGVSREIRSRPKRIPLR